MAVIKRGNLVPIFVHALNAQMNLDKEKSAAISRRDHSKKEKNCIQWAVDNGRNLSIGHWVYWCLQRYTRAYKGVMGFTKVY